MLYNNMINRLENQDTGSGRILPIRDLNKIQCGIWEDIDRIRYLTGSGQLESSGCRPRWCGQPFLGVWKGISGKQDVNKIQCGIWENVDGTQNVTAA